jgi:hypothetical protein
LLYKVPDGGIWVDDEWAAGQLVCPPETRLERRKRMKKIKRNRKLTARKAG